MDFKTGFKTYQHPEWGCWIDLNDGFDVDSYFSQREISNKRDSGLYFIYDECSRLVYIGEGVTTIDLVSGEPKLRAASHKQNIYGTELVCKYVRPGWTIKIIAYGLTKLEGCILEAYFIREELKKGRKLTQIGATEWDGDSLMNKNRGMSDNNFNKTARMFLKKK